MASRESKVPIRRPREIAFTRKTFLVAIFIIAQGIFITSSMFRVQAVEVTGNSHLHDDVIRAQAALPLQGHLFFVPLRSIEERIRGLHWVSEVAVRRYMPGRIQIRVKEKTPVMAVATSGQGSTFPRGWFVVSEDGTILAPAGGEGDDKLPRVLLHSTLLVGHKLPATIVATVRKTLADVPKRFAAAVRELRSDEQGQLFLTLTVLGRPVEVRLGGAERSAYKFQVLQALLERVQEEGKPVAYIDLRYTDPAVGHLAAATAPATAEAQQ